MNMLQGAVAIVFSQLRKLNPLIEVTRDRGDTTRQRLAIHIVQQNPKPRSRGDLGNAMSHRAGADYGYGLNRFQTATWAAHHTVDYPNIRSYTIRSTEKAILSCPLWITKRSKEMSSSSGPDRPVSRPQFTRRAPASSRCSSMPPLMLTNRLRRA